MKQSRDDINRWIDIYTRVCLKIIPAKPFDRCNVVKLNRSLTLEAADLTDTIVSGITVAIQSWEDENQESFDPSKGWIEEE